MIRFIYGHEKFRKEEEEMGKIRKEIRKDMKDEKNARKGYVHLSRELAKNKNKKAARTVRAIEHDEIDHRKLLKKILKKQK